jgi:S-DNA-T family DNA segregation ATPase FtsK/SpoIIIE
MSEKKKNQLRNTLKEEVQEPVVKKTEKKEKPKKEKEKTAEAEAPAEKPAPGKNPFAPALALLRNERFHKIAGLTLLLLSVYMLIAFTSFLFTWKVDQDKVMGPAAALFLTEVQVNNWLGKLGAVIAHQFIHRWFGVAAFLFPLMFFVAGTRILFGIRIMPLRKTFAYSFFSLIWISVALAYIFSTTWFYLGGGFGFVANNYFNGIIGKAGTGFLLFFSALVFGVVAFNLSFDWFKKASEENNNEEETQEDIQDAAQNVFKPVSEDAVNTIDESSITPEEEAAALEMVLEVRPPVEEAIAEPAAQTITEELPQHDIEEPIAEEEPVQELELDTVQLLTEAADGVQFSVETVKEEVIPAEILNEMEQVPLGEYDPTLELSSYQFPPIDLLEAYGGKGEAGVNTEELNANKNRIVDTLNNYGIQIEKIKATIGPTVTLYEIIPAAGVRISKIKNLEDDIALSLSALGIRIIAPIPGKGTIGIEVPNQNPETVAMRAILASEKFQSSGMELPLGLGKTISNETFIVDLAKMPHLLMAGATGQGKSVGLNAILVSLLYKKHPSQIKFVLVDPKKVELTLFNKIERHFLAKLPDSEEAIITDTKKVINTLNSLCIEMDQRYDLLKDAQVRNIKEYNTKFIARKLNPNKGHKFLPYIVLVVDEFADLIMTAGKEVEMPIARLAQLARAIGIHLIIATQRPSVNIITGTIKANFPARIAFRVTSKIDSRTILDAGGAEQLIGRGDMLFSTGSDLIRLQCGFVDTPEVDKITDFIGSQRSYPNAFLLPEYVGEGEESDVDFEMGDRDEFFDQAAEIVVEHQQGSASLLQRRLKLGYNRAGRIIDQLEAAGIIGPFKGSKAREVLIKDRLSLEQYLSSKEKPL